MKDDSLFRRSLIRKKPQENVEENSKIQGGKEGKKRVNHLRRIGVGGGDGIVGGDGGDGRDGGIGGIGGIDGVDGGIGGDSIEDGGSRTRGGGLTGSSTDGLRIYRTIQEKGELSKRTIRNKHLHSRLGKARLYNTWSPV